MKYVKSPEVPKPPELLVALTRWSPDPNLPCVWEWNRGRPFTIATESEVARQTNRRTKVKGRQEKSEKRGVREKGTNLRERRVKRKKVRSKENEENESRQKTEKKGG